MTSKIELPASAEIEFSMCNKIQAPDLGCSLYPQSMPQSLKRLSGV